MKHILLLFLFLLSIPAKGNVLDLSNLPDNLSNNLESSSSYLIEPPITKAKLDNLIRWIYRNGNFRGVRISQQRKGDVNVYKVIVERTPTIQKVFIKGDEPLSSSKLLDAANISSGQAYDIYELRNAANRALELIKKNAYLNARIEIEVNDSPVDENKKLVYFNITSGKRFEIGKIQTDTENSFLKEEIQDITNNYEEEHFTSDFIDDMQKEIREFLSDNSFYNTRLEEPQYEFDNKNSRVNIFLNLNGKYRYSLIFNDNNKMSDLKILNELDLEGGKPLGINPGADLAERIKEIYKNNGYANIDLSYKSKTLDKELKREVIFELNEGNKIHIKDYIIEGNISLSKEKYKSLIHEFSGDLIKKDLYHEAQIDNGLKNLVTHLQNQGYLKARLLSHRVSYGKNNKKVTIYIRMDEGPRTYIEKISFHKTQAFEKKRLLRVVDLNEGSPLLLPKIEEAIDKLNTFYKKQGYLDVSIDQDSNDFLVYFDDNKKANLNFYINEGDQIVVDRIEIIGNSFTNNHAIRTALDFKKGDTLTSEKIKESESNLRRLGIFNSVGIRHLGGATAKRAVRVNVSERKPGTLTFGVGISNELGLTTRGYTGLAYRNLWGTARAIQGRIELSSNEKATDFIDYKVNASYLEPFLLDSKTKGKINILASQSLTSNSNADLEAAESVAIDFVLEKDINRFLKLTWQLWGIERNKIFEVKNENIQEERNIAELGPIIELDYRNNPFIPTAGTYTRLTMDYSSPDIGSSESKGQIDDIKTVHFIRSNLLFNHYLPFFDSSKVTLAYSLRGGYLKNLGKDGISAVPKERLFFLGGINTIRGFETNSIPNDELLITPGDSFASVNTESYYYLTKVEIRVPIYNDFGTAFFYDGGGVQVVGKDLGDTYRNSIGLSFRYLTPIGAINLGYGYKLDRDFDSNESEGAIFFSIGDF